jgi:hypothetical protein
MHSTNDNKNKKFISLNRKNLEDSSSSKIIPYKKIKTYKRLETDNKGKVNLIDIIPDTDETVNVYHKAFYDDKNEIVFIESYLNKDLLNCEYILNNGRITKKRLFNGNGNEDFYIEYLYKNNRICEEKALDNANKLIYVLYYNKTGKIIKLNVFKR